MKKTHKLILLSLFSSTVVLSQDPCPEAKMTDPAIEEGMLNAFKDDERHNAGKEASKAVITVRDWTVLHNQTTNAPYKKITAAILYKKKDKCLSEVLDFESRFDGVEYSKTFKIIGWRKATSVSCDCLLKTN